MRWRDLPTNPPIKTLRWFALYGFAAFAVLAAWQYHLDRGIAALAFLTLSLVLGVLGLLRPALLRPIFVASLVVTFPLGWLISHVLLFLLFYGLFTPLGLLFRLLGRDPLALRFRREYTTYWSEKPAASDVRSYFRQS